MRKIFGGSVILSLVGAVLIGGALAWVESAQTDEHDLEVGDLDWSLEYVPCPEFEGEGDCDPPLIGPNGNTTEIGHGFIENEGDFRIKLRGATPDDWGMVDVQWVDNGHPQCNTANFLGSMRASSGTSLNPVQPGNHGGDFNVDMKVAEGAPEACMGAIVSYVAEITIQTVGSNP